MIKFSRFDELKSKMENYVVSLTEKEDLFEPPAFCMIRDGFVGDIYRIYVNSMDESIKNFLYMHECGHIIFDHVDNADKKAISVKSRIKVRFDEYKEWFDNEEDFFDYFKNYIFNVVEDFEVNSKLFSKEEFDEACKTMAKLNPNWGRGMWPEDYGYPIGKTWREYLTFLLDDLPKFLTNVENSNNNKNNEGLGNGSGKGKSPKKLSKKTMKKIKSEVEKKSDKELEKLSQEIDSQNGKGIGDQKGETVLDTNEDIYSFEELKNIFKKKVFTKKNVMTKRDQMYNVNRRKLGNSNLIIPRNVCRTEFRADEFYVILDVSSSVNQKLISSTISVFRELADEFGKNSRIIMWDMECQFDGKLKDLKDNDKFTIGGGTCIAKAIRYVSKNYIKNTNKKLFIISDFEDDLTDWKNQIKAANLKELYGINWSYNNDDYIKETFKDEIFKKIYGVNAYGD